MGNSNTQATLKGCLRMVALALVFTAGRGAGGAGPDPG